MKEHSRANTPSPTIGGIGLEYKTREGVRKEGSGERGKEREGERGKEGKGGRGDERRKEGEGGRRDERRKEGRELSGHAGGSSKGVTKILSSLQLALQQ